MGTYNKTVWQDGDIITADKMNNIENGIYSYNEDLSESVADLKADLQDLQDEIGGGGSGLTADLKAALDQLAQKVAYIDTDGQDYYDALHAALYPPANLTRIFCVYTQSGTVYDTDSLNSLKSDLVVTAHFSDNTTQIVTTYTLSGTLTEGTSTITVSYGGKTATFSVTVTHWEPVTASITWSGSGTDKTSSVIDATQYDVYYDLPFVEGASQLIEGATESSDAFRIYDTHLFSDAEKTNSVGYYRVDTGEIAESARVGSRCPNYAFDTKIKAIPRGYYADIVIAKSTASFSTNADFMNYIQANGSTVTLETGGD